MRLREVYLKNAETLADSGSVSIDLPSGMKILKLRFQYQAKNGATSNTVGRLNSMVSAIQVLNGSEVLESGSMREWQAKNFHDYHRLPYQALSQVAGDVVVEECVIDFRRFEGDTQFYLDSSMYANAQISATHSLTISGTAGFVTGTGKLSVIATVIDSGAPSRLGFVSMKEVKSFASAASGDTDTDLPRDNKLATVMVLDPVDGETPDNYLSNFKISADTDGFIPVDTTYADLLRDNLERFGYAEQRQSVNPDTSVTVDGDLYAETGGYAAQAGATSLSVIQAVAANEMTVAMTTGGSGVVAALRGIAPHAAVFYDFGDGKSADQIFDPTGVGKLQLILTNANTGATPKVCVVQQRS